MLFKNAAIALSLLVTTASADDAWRCNEVQKQTLTESGSVTWSTFKCTNKADEEPSLGVNLIEVDSMARDVRVVPGVSTDDATKPLKPLNEMAHDNQIAGINGGYFWRTDIDGHWVDDVCRGKIRKEAEMPPMPGQANWGINDGLVIIDGKLVGSNCDKKGYSRPAILVIDGANSHVEVKHRGEGADNQVHVKNAISAGPNLVSYNATTGSSFVDIPSDDDNINILEHAANTGVGVRYFPDTPGKVSTFVMVTTDGTECGAKNDACGLTSRGLASLMLNEFGVHEAMSMDQGGSTTMFVRGQPNNGIVSKANSGGGARNVANGLFVELL